MFKKDKGRNKYSHMDEEALFGFIVNAINGGGDRGQSFPRSDAEDFSRGLRFVPGEVTEARRSGENVVFFDQHCGNPCCWYWQFSDKSRTYYWQRYEFELVAAANGKHKDPKGNYPDGVGSCPSCGNTHIRGGHVKYEDLGKPT